MSTNLWTSAIWSPVVGSSKMYSVFPVALLDNSVASLTLCASPPDNVVDGCPSLMYPKSYVMQGLYFLFDFWYFIKEC